LQLALTPGADEETIIAALLHDIGQFLPHASTQMMHNGTSLGRLSHDAVGEAFLRSLGFPPKVCALVGAHVVAKRYLTATRAGYLETLSRASRLSLTYQGGPFNAAQVAAFERDPLCMEKIALRLWDDAAKRDDWEVPGLETYRPMMLRVLQAA
jgi:predicted HD phosphohydrolase